MNEREHAEVLDACRAAGVSGLGPWAGRAVWGPPEEGMPWGLIAGDPSTGCTVHGPEGEAIGGIAEMRQHYGVKRAGVLLVAFVVDPEGSRRSEAFEVGSLAEGVVRVLRRSGLAPAKMIDEELE